MIRKAFREAITACLLTLSLTSTAFAGELRSVVLTAAGGSAQLTLDLTDATAQELFTLESPDRTVIDLPHTHLASGVRAPEGAGIVAAVRLGERHGGTLRVVVQTKAPLPAHSAWGPGESGRLLVVSLGAATIPPLADLQPRALRVAHAPGEGDRDVIIAVDAGHGGEDPGAIGHGGTREKAVTLAIARALAVRIDAEPGMHAVLTRDRDEFVPLEERIRRARLAHADMFISVHADSISDRSISGASVYILSTHGASSEAARVLADKENAADLVGGIRLADVGALAPVLLDATQQETIGVSAAAAERVVSALESVGEVRKAQVQHAGFVVLKSPAIPAMLIETAYISNPTEERRLRNPGQQERLAEAICGGVRAFFLENPPDGTRFKQEHLASAASATAAATP